MRKIFLLMFLLALSALANDNNEEAKIKAAVEDRYQEWLAAENKQDPAAITALYDDNAVLMPKAEEFVIGKAAIGEYYKVTEEIESHLRQKPVQAWLSGNDLKIATLDQNEKELVTWRKS